MEKINKFITKTPRKFWLYNSIVALIFFLIAPHNFFQAILFPFVVITVRYITLNYLTNVTVKYLGFYPFKKDIKWFLITLAISFVLYQTSFTIMILGGLLILWQDGYFDHLKIKK